MEKKLTSKDLMVGDWVLNTYHNKPMRVKEICADKIILEGQDRYKMEGFEPIPITPEILEKNGFTSKTYDAGDEEFTQWLSEDGRIEICEGFTNSDKRWNAHIDNEDYETIGGADVDCVHELQHLLKLCEIEMEVKI